MPRRPVAQCGIGHVVGKFLGGRRARFGQFRARFGALSEAAQIVRTAGLRPGAGKPLAAEGLRADHGADLVAVDIDVAGMDAVDEMLGAALDAGVQAEGEPKTLGVDGADDGIDLVGLEGGDMQHRPEHLALHLLDPLHAEHRGSDEAAVLRHVQPGKQLAVALHLRAIVADGLLRLVVDDGADIRCDLPGVADGERFKRALQHRQRLCLHILLHVEHAQRRTALAGALEGGGQDVAHRLLGQRGGIHHHGVQPPGLGDQHGVGRGGLGQLLLDQLRHLGRAGEADPGDARIGRQRRADVRSVTGQELQHVLRHAGLVQHLDGATGDQRRLLGRLGDHRIAGDERCRDLAGEDGERKVPRRDACDRPARLRARLGRGGLLGVVAQEIHRLAHLGHAVGQRLAGFARGEREELDRVLLVKVGSPAQDFSTLRNGPRRPGRLRRNRDAHRLAHLLLRRLDHRADDFVRLGGIGNGALSALARGAGERLRPPAVGTGKGRPALVDRRQRHGVGDVPATGVAAPVAEDRGGLGDVGIGRRPVHFHDLQRIPGNRLGGHRLVGQLMDEGGIGAVLQKPPHQIGQKVGMRAHRRIDAAARAFGLTHRLVQLLAHAVQALELEAVAILRHGQDRGDGVGVVGGELRIDAVGHRQELAGAGHVGHVRVGLAGEDRIAGKAEHLRALDLRVPIGALDEAHHDPAVELLRQRMEPVDGESAARPVGLHHHAEAVPVGKARIGQHLLDDVQRQVETVGLLGIDIEAHARLLRRQRQRQQPLGHHRQHGFPLRDLVARVDSGELHRDALVAADVGAVGG